MNAIEICQLNQHYSDFSLQELDLALPQGCILGLVGENGAGKSTTIRLIMNAIARDSGTVRVLGVDNQSREFRRVKQDIGVVLDEAYFPEVLTAQRMERVLAGTYENWDSGQFQQYLDRFHLPRRKAFAEFSRGMKMKLAIAAALSHAPKLLILDEATSGLDPMVRDEMLEIFSEFTRDETHSVLLSSHIVSDLEKVCDYIAFLHKGRLRLCEEKDRMLEEWRVLKTTRQQLEAVPPEAICGLRETPYGVEALVERSRVSPAFPTERATLEDIILFMAKEGEK